MSNKQNNMPQTIIIIDEFCDGVTEVCWNHEWAGNVLYISSEPINLETIEVTDE